jgi:hypothetical protein
MADGCQHTLTCRFLHGQLVKNQEVTPSNEGLVVETLRTLSELMIYGDKHSEQFFEYVPALCTPLVNFLITMRPLAASSARRRCSLSSWTSSGRTSTASR